MGKGESKLPTLSVHESVADCWSELPVDVRSELGDFLRALQRNPYDPDLLARSELSNDRYGCRFYEEYVIFWKLKLKSSSSLVTLNSQAVAGINILEIKTIPVEVDRAIQYDQGRISGSSA